MTGSWRYALAVAFKMPPRAQGVAASGPWSIERIGEWLVMSRCSTTAVEAAKLPEAVSEASALARKALLEP